MLFRFLLFCLVRMGSFQFVQYLSDKVKRDTDMKGLWLGGLALMLAMGACVGSVYGYHASLDGNIMDIVDHGQVLVDDTADFMCTHVRATLFSSILFNSCVCSLVSWPRVRGLTTTLWTCVWMDLWVILCLMGLIRSTLPSWTSSTTPR